MKKLISLSTGILVFAILLINWGCCRSAKGQDHKNVTIHLQAVIKEGKKHLKLSDSNGAYAEDHLLTSVASGGTITWKLKKSSKIETIVRIYSPKENKVIFKEDAIDTGSNIFTLKVPVGLRSGTLEEYNIIFIHSDGERVEIDPYIRIE